MMFQGLSVVTLSILSGFGFTAMIGIKFSPLAGGVVPFLALGLGKQMSLTRDISLILFILSLNSNPNLRMLWDSWF